MFTITPMVIDHYDALMNLMRQTPGVSVRDADSLTATTRYLDRNPGLSFIAKVGDEIVGCVMSGHDGRRGYLQHLVVLSEYRRQGIAKALVDSCLLQLDALGIQKTHIDVLKTNEMGAAFWEGQGWNLRTDIHRYSFVPNGKANA